jgi:hypothetical protein
VAFAVLAFHKFLGAGRGQNRVDVRMIGLRQTEKRNRKRQWKKWQKTGKS